MKAFLERKQIQISAKRYFIDAMGAMALGLFASLLIGTIFGTLGDKLSLPFCVEIANFAKAGYVVGAAIGMAIASSLSAPPLVLYTCAVVGAMSYSLGAAITLADGSQLAYTAGPAGVFFAAIVACEFGKLVSKETKLDIIVTPAVTLLVGYGLSKLICPAIAYVMYYLGDFINTATVMQPFIMGIVISVVVGVILTLPISSAAICAMIGITGLAGGAAVAGCCAQMVGFAVISFRENRWGGLVAQGLGTSMLQMGNIVRHPQIWIPPTLAAAVTGPIATMVFQLECTGVSAGMGTCGLVGVLGVLTDMGGGAQMWLGILLVCFVLPAILSLIFSEFMRKMGWIRPGDMKLNV